MRAAATTEHATRIPTHIHVEDDHVLIEGIRTRNEAALADAYRIHGKAVYSAAFAVLRSRGPAEDVTQEVFVRLWNRADRFDPARGSLRSYLRIDARGRAIDLIRSERARRDREDRETRLKTSETASGVEEEAMTHLTSDGVTRMLLDLRPEERTPIALAYLDGHSYRRVAELLGLPEGTVKSRIRSGLANLKGVLAAAGIEPA